MIKPNKKTKTKLNVGLGRMVFFFVVVKKRSVVTDDLCCSPTCLIHTYYKYIRTLQNSTFDTFEFPRFSISKFPSFHIFLIITVSHNLFVA